MSLGKATCAIAAISFECFDINFVIAEGGFDCDGFSSDVIVLVQVGNLMGKKYCVEVKKSLV